VKVEIVTVIRVQNEERSIKVDIVLRWTKENRKSWRGSLPLLNAIQIAHKDEKTEGKGCWHLASAGIKATGSRQQAADSRQQTTDSRQQRRLESNQRRHTGPPGTSQHPHKGRKTLYYSAPSNDPVNYVRAKHKALNQSLQNGAS
jgi:hypothetical protein